MRKGEVGKERGHAKARGTKPMRSDRTRGWGRWCTQSVALGWYTVSRWDTGCGAVLKRNRVCLFGDASLVDDGTPPFEALVGVAEFFRLCSLVLDDEFDEGILRMVYFGEED